MRLKTKFQDEDFELGEVVNAKITDLTCYEDDKRFKVAVSAKKGGEHTFFYSSIAEFLEMWEDAPEEPKVGYIIDPMEEECVSADDSGYEDPDVERAKELGIWFESEEEAARAVEKLKAFKRLKDKGFRFEGIKEDYTRITQAQNPFRTGKRYLQFNKSEDEYWMKENWKDLDICFGGEE